MQPMISDMGLGRAWGSHDDPPVRFFRPKLEEEPTPVLANFCAMTSDEDPATAISEVAIPMGCSAVLDEQACADTLKSILSPNLPSLAEKRRPGHVSATRVPGLRRHSGRADAIRQTDGDDWPFSEGTDTERSFINWTLGAEVE
jgi:hypothetical protein